MNSATKNISITLLGEPRLLQHDQVVPLPPSKKTRALLVYLVLTNRPHRRDRLCEIFWDQPDDPRAALRWSLSMIRSLINQGDTERLVADRERVSVALDDVEIDIVQLSDQLADPSLGIETLENILKKLQENYLDGVDLPSQELFQQWLQAERQEVVRMQGIVLDRLSSHAHASVSQRLQWVKKWSALDPFNPVAATRLISELALQSDELELARVTNKLTLRFRNAGIAWSPSARTAVSSIQEQGVAQLNRDLLMQQKISFCQASDGVRLAYASVGSGTPIIKAANWLSHLEHDWDAPIWSPLFRALAKDHHFVRYDERGNGLSDWDVDSITFESFVTDLEAIVDATGIEQSSLLGISQGAAVSIEYAIRYPQRVKHLILFGGYDTGWRVGTTPDEIREREAIMTLTGSGWGRDNPAYRQIFSSTFMPSANSEELSWFNEFQRLTTSPENAVRFLSVFGDIDVREQLAKLRVPTLVIHSLGDSRIPVSVGQHLAESIPNAEFVGLRSDGHLLLGREPASQVFVDKVKDFIARN